MTTLVRYLMTQTENYYGHSIILFFSRLSLFLRSKIKLPVTVAERSKACTVFGRSEAGIVGSNSTQCMDVWCVCVGAFFCVYVQVEALRRADHPPRES
jgi:hypothetical protein